MSDLSLYFSKLQIPKLEAVGFKSMFDFITYFPYKLKTIQPLKGYPKENETYLWQGKLVNIEFRKGQKRFLVLYFLGDREIKAYSFNSSPYLLKILKEGGDYQMVLNYKNNLWSLEKIGLFIGNLNGNNLILGKAKLQNYLIPKYEKMGFLTANYFIQLHSKLPDSVYLLDLKGLAPENNLFPNILNLAQIHKPTSEKDFLSSTHSWLAFKVFLRLSLVKYVDLDRKQNFARSSKLDVDFLKAISNNLPFTLSDSQKQTIWEILNQL